MHRNVENKKYLKLFFFLSYKATYTKIAYIEKKNGVEKVNEI